MSHDVVTAALTVNDAIQKAARWMAWLSLAGLGVSWLVRHSYVQGLKDRLDLGDDEGDGEESRGGGFVLCDGCARECFRFAHNDAPQQPEEVMCG